VSRPSRPISIASGGSGIPLFSKTTASFAGEAFSLPSEGEGSGTAGGF